MGNKGTKAQMDKLLQLAEDGEAKKGASKEELAACLASLSDMAQAGTRVGAGAEGGLTDREQALMSPENLRDMRRKLRSKMTHRGSSSQEQEEDSMDDLFKQLNLVDSQDDSKDWAYMRNWLVWCMHTNLDNMGDEDEITEHVHSRVTGRRRQMRRQTSVDCTRSRRRLSHQVSLDADILAGRMTAQSSLESNGET